MNGIMVSDRVCSDTHAKKVWDGVQGHGTTDGHDCERVQCAHGEHCTCMRPAIHLAGRPSTNFSQRVLVGDDVISVENLR